MSERGNSGTLATISISVGVAAREVRFEARGPSGVRFWGRPGYRSVWRSLRTRLPEVIEPGRPYREVLAASSWELEPLAQRGAYRVEEHEHREAPPARRAVPPALGKEES